MAIKKETFETFFFLREITECFSILTSTRRRINKISLFTNTKDWSVLPLQHHCCHKRGNMYIKSRKQQFFAFLF
jgi:hypothetical protein